MSNALEEYFKTNDNPKELIKEVHLDRNGLSDQGLSNLLRGIGDSKKVQKLSIFNNELGPETLKVLTDLYFESLTSLAIKNVKMSPEVRKEFFI
jgi:Ran GTPase-activating protein (RanGAP) involved in mRNA processing and transport